TRTAVTVPVDAALTKTEPRRNEESRSARRGLTYNRVLLRVLRIPWCLRGPARVHLSRSFTASGPYCASRSRSVRPASSSNRSPSAGSLVRTGGEVGEARPHLAHGAA